MCMDGHHFVVRMFDSNNERDKKMSKVRDSDSTVSDSNLLIQYRPLECSVTATN